MYIMRLLWSIKIIFKLENVTQQQDFKTFLVEAFYRTIDGQVKNGCTLTASIEIK